MSTSAPTETFNCSCHCGQIKFTVDLAADTSSWSITRCNCTICHKAGYLTVAPDVKTFKFVGEEPTEDKLGDYTFASKKMHHRFCKNCGVSLFCRGVIPELGGDFIALQAHVIDGVDLSKITKEKKYWNGREEKWHEGPQATPAPPGQW